MNATELKPEWAKQIDREISELNLLKANLLDFYQRIGKELERRGWTIGMVLWYTEIQVSKQSPTKEDFFEVLQLIGDLFDYHPKYFPYTNEGSGVGLAFLYAFWYEPYQIRLMGYNPTGCKIEYKEVTKTVFELVKVDCPEFQEQP